MLVQDHVVNLLMGQIPLLNSILTVEKFKNVDFLMIVNKDMEMDHVVQKLIIAILMDLIIILRYLALIEVRVVQNKVSWSIFYQLSVMIIKSLV